MMMDSANPNQNRGYAFVTYLKKESALQAMDRLHQKEMNDFCGQRVRVQPSQAKNKLWVGGLPHSMGQDSLREALEALGLKGLQNIELAKNKDNPEAANRGFAFLEFYNATAAVQAKTKLSAPEVRIADRTINVDVAEPSGRDVVASGGSKTIFVGNLGSAQVTEEQLRGAFSTYGEIEKVNIPRPKDGEGFSKFAFVHFTERVAAAHAVEAEEKPEIDGVTLAVKYGSSSGGGGGGGGHGGYHQQQQQPYQQQQQQQYGGGGRYQQQQQQQQHYGMPGMQMMGGGMMGMVAVQLPNGQMGFMAMPTGGMMGGGGGDGMGMGMGGGMMRPRGGWRGGGRGGGGGRDGGGHRYQPY